MLKAEEQVLQTTDWQQSKFQKDRIPPAEDQKSEGTNEKEEKFDGFPISSSND